ncbi:MAG: efflux RND transporter periplasmic adaptor subunit [Thermoanaerobaculia bacterium]|nr:efflux RND transporter periplasmic adaptor subunit [Thermoanaerobaculia bacterium]
MTVRWPAIAGGVAVVAAVVAASIGGGGGEKSTPVYLEKAAARDIEEVVAAPGQIDPRVKVNLSSNVIGKIEKLHFKEGDDVSKGQLLVDLERASYEAQRNRMQAELANRQIEVRRARVNLENAEIQFGRAQRLREQGIQAEELYDRSRVELANAKANLEAAGEFVRQAEAGLRQATEDLGYTRIVSPMDGKVVQLNAQEGEVVITGTMNNLGSVIAVIADLSEILVEADVTEIEVVKIRASQVAKVKIDAIADHEYKGEVVEIGSSATLRAGSTSGVRYFKVKVQIMDPDERLRPGMTSQVDIIVSSKKGVVAVPVQSVVEIYPSELSKKDRGSKNEQAKAGEEKKKYVFVMEDGKAAAREVKTGISDATHVEIASGAQAGEEIVTGPFRTLKKLHDGETIVKDEGKSSGKSKSDKKDDSEKDEEKDED